MFNFLKTGFKMLLFKEDRPKTLCQGFKTWSTLYAHQKLIVTLT